MTSVPPPGRERGRGAHSLNAAPRTGAGGGAGGLEPLPRRLMGAVACLAVLLLAVIVNYALHEDENPFNPIARAAERTQRAGGGRAIMEVVYSSAELPSPVVATGKGVYNERTGRSSFTLNVPKPGFGEIQVRGVGDDRTIYLSSRELSEQLPGPRRWMAIQPLLGRNQTASLAGNGGAREGLEMLTGVSDDVDSLGAARVRGVATERYRGSVDLAAFSRRLAAHGEAGLAHEYEVVAERMPDPIEVEVWIDRRNVVRRMREVMTMPTTGGRSAVTVDTRVDLVDLGIAPRIHFPPARTVFDATPLVRAELGLFEGHALGPLTPPAGAPALAATAFRRRANRICARLLDRTAAIGEAAKARSDEIRRLGESGDLKGVARAARAYAYEFLEPLLPIANGSLRRLARLAPPPQLAPGYRRFLLASVRSSEMAEATARGFEVGELKLANSLDKRMGAAGDASDQAARQLGLDDCIGEVGGESSDSPA